MKAIIKKTKETEVVIENGYYTFGFSYFRVTEDAVLEISSSHELCDSIMMEVHSPDQFSYRQSAISGMTKVTKEEFEREFRKTLIKIQDKL